MTALVGDTALVLALLVALVQASVPLIGVASGRQSWMHVAPRAAQVHFALLLLAFGCLVTAFVRLDFSVAYVADNANHGLPMHLRVAAAWGGHEGSLLMWVLMQAAWGLAVAQRSAHLPAPFRARVLAVLGAVSAGFLLFTVFTSNPFVRLDPAPLQGQDLNPLLQDMGMMFHPPLLYMGYVGFSVAFAFAVAALLEGRVDAHWARWTRPWTTGAWCCLTMGIMLGSAWAYYELGWGGWWFWDPVENASFMPWLIGTALIHSLAVTEKRGAFKAWTVLLALTAFSLSLLGAFLVRSGVLSSVHAFAVDPARGLFVLIFLGVVVGGSLALYAWRAPMLGLGGRFDAVSRETFLLGNNLLFAASAASVLLGTLYPLALDVLGLGRISVGAPYFEAVFVPMMAGVAFLLGIGPLARWKQASLPDLACRLRWAVPVVVASALTGAWAAGEIRAGAVMGLAMAGWIVAGVAVDALERARDGALGRQPRGWWGMTAAHLGFAVAIVGICLVSSHERVRDVRLAAGESVILGDYTFTFHGVRPWSGPNYDAVQGLVVASRSGTIVAELYPQKRVYRVQREPMTEAAIQSGFTRDLFVSLGEPLDGGRSWVVHVAVKPFIDWIWAGCVMMALGGLLAASDRRYRATRREPATAKGSGPGAASGEVPEGA